MPRPTLAERFWAKVNKNGPNGCWLWTAKTSVGYGYISVGGGKNEPAHRVSYELNVGPIPAGLHIDHLCRVKVCVNPAHLEPVTCRENVVRGHIARGTYRYGVRRTLNPNFTPYAERTHCPRNHPYDAVNTYWHRRKDGRLRRSCKACNAIARAESTTRRTRAGAR